MVFYSDAARATFSMIKGQRYYHDNVGRGVSCIGGENLESIWGWSRLSWPEGLLTHMKDEKGCWFGSKSATLEAVGLLIPMIVFPEYVAGKQLVFKVDNTAVMWGWYNGCVKNYKSASDVLKAVRYLGGLLGASIYVEHVDRMSNDMASLADELSRRENSKCQRNQTALENAVFRPTSGYLLEWLSSPCSGNNLLKRLLEEKE